MRKLYPLKFKPIFKDKVWGGQRLHKLFGKDFSPLPNCGESWEISGVKGNVSLVQNGFLEDNNLQELIEVYMGDLVGEKVFGQFGDTFPLLVKFLDTNDYLSIQVHPDDKIARERYKSKGKSEMWYVVHADPGAEIIAGFKHDVDPDTYLHHLENNTLKEILNVEEARPGDVFYIPAGRIHAIGSGITLCEIQQTSDITFRVYDWDRPGQDGKLRELHTDEALNALDFKSLPEYKTLYREETNGSAPLVDCPYFTTNLLNFNRKIQSDYFFLDSFVIFVCLEGDFRIVYPGGSEKVKNGEAVVLPAEIKAVELIPDKPCRVLESYIK